MGTREVYEKKLRNGNLYYEPTLNPGLGSARCPRCLSLVEPNSKSGEWTITSVLHDATAVLMKWCFDYSSQRQKIFAPSVGSSEILFNNVGHFFTPMVQFLSIIVGSGIGGMLSAVYGINTGIPHIQNRVRGPKWLPFLIGMPPLLMFSATCAAFGGYALPKFAQLTVTSYYAASSASHYGISQLTRRIEDLHTSQSHHERLR